MIYEYLCSKIISSDACNWDNVGIVGVAVTVKMTKASELITSIHQITESSCIPWIDIGLEVPLVHSSKGALIWQWFCHDCNCLGIIKISDHLFKT
jgi:hypothetical protein